MEDEAPLDDARALINQAKSDLETAGLSPAVIFAVGQCLWRRTKSPNFSQRVAKVLLAGERGEAALQAACRELRLRPRPDQ